MNSKTFFKILIFFSIIALSYIFYKSEIIHEGLRVSYYLTYYFLIIAFLTFFVLVYNLKKKIRDYSLIVFFSIVISIYLYEGFVVYKMEKNVDLTSQKFKVNIYKKLKKKNPNIRVVMDPAQHLRNPNLNFIPLSGISNIETINCKESSFFSVFKSDRFGFNNPDRIWNNDFIENIVVGDSFSLGSCVNRPNDITSVLNELSTESSLTIGYNSNGPLLALASLKEYLFKDTTNVLWLYFEGNDLEDLEAELGNPILIKYLNDKNFTQNLKTQQKKIDKFLNNIFINEFQENLNKITNIANRNKSRKNRFKRFVNFIKLYETRQLLFHSFPLNHLKKVLLRAKNLSNEKGAKFYFVYLPSYERYKYGKDINKYESVLRMVNQLDIEIIDIHKEIFSKIENPLSLFPYSKNGHYNENGYRQTALVIHNLINN